MIPMLQLVRKLIGATDKVFSAESGFAMLPRTCIINMQATYIIGI